MIAGELQQLLDKYLADTISAAELERLRTSVRSAGEGDVLQTLIHQVLSENRYADQLPGDKQQLFQAMLAEARMREAASAAPLVPVRSRWRIAAAAAVLLCMVAATWLWYRQPAVHTSHDAFAAARHIMPGGNKAMLTLADGSTIVLDSASNGTLANQSGTQVIKQADGRLVYTKGQTAANAAPALNTLRTPRGGQYQLTLPDGTEVWLNAASSIQYPAVFTGHERQVTITGEAYFEVAANAAMPFRVTARGQTIEVLGTYFNVNAYEDESVGKTTLLQGSVKVNDNLLIPGQQARVSIGANGVQTEVVAADVTQAIAWKNGLFSCQGATLQEVMRQLSRWYDIDVQYEGAVPPFRFGGKIQRNLNLADLLDILKKAEVNFRMEEGRKLIVTQ